jgi:hypothetical protein
MSITMISRLMLNLHKQAESGIHTTHNDARISTRLTNTHMQFTTAFDSIGYSVGHLYSQGDDSRLQSNGEIRSCHAAEEGQIASRSTHTGRIGDLDVEMNKLDHRPPRVS